MKNKKTILWIALIAMATIPVYAQEEEYDGLFKGHSIDGGKGLEITGYVGSSNEVHIPSYLYGLPVTSIGRGAFKDHIFITHVIIPDSVTSIGVGAFWGCNILLDVVIPDSVTTIEDEAFLGCMRLSSITIPKSVTRIGRGAFNDCIDLVRVIFEGTIASSGFNSVSKYSSFPGDLRSRFYATDKSNGTPGTYVRTGTGRANTKWTKQK
ncbi:MAG: leucine-rich repeat domain-containing protein [Treponema sp.]|nr:leucine-rich repeat domain-containing protein [Treponema sp.]